MKQVVVSEVLCSYYEFNALGKQSVLVLHGWGQSAREWLSVAQLLADEYRMIVVDLPGFGNSAFLPGDAGLSEYRMFVEALIEKLELEQPVVLGHSFGGQIAADLAAKDVDVEGLILVAPSIFRDVEGVPQWKRKLIVWLSPIVRMMSEGARERLRNLVGSEDYLGSSRKQQEIFSRIIRQDVSGVLGSIAAPTVVIWGDRDQAIAYKGKELVARLHQGRLRVVYGGGHNLHLTHPQDLVRHIRHYLSP